MKKKGHNYYANVVIFIVIAFFRENGKAPEHETGLRTQILNLKMSCIFQKIFFNASSIT